MDQLRCHPGPLLDTPVASLSLMGSDWTEVTRPCTQTIVVDAPLAYMSVDVMIGSPSYSSCPESCKWKYVGLPTNLFHILQVLPFLWILRNA